MEEGSLEGSVLSLVRKPVRDPDRPVYGRCQGAEGDKGHYQGQKSTGWLIQPFADGGVEKSCESEKEKPLRPLHDTNLADDALTLPPCPCVADQKGSTQCQSYDQGDHGPRVEIDSKPGKDADLGESIKGRVQEGSFGGSHPHRPGDPSVKYVGRAPEEHEPTSQNGLSQRKSRSGSSTESCPGQVKKERREPRSQGKLDSRADKPVKPGSNEATENKGTSLLRLQGVMERMIDTEPENSHASKTEAKGGQ